MAAYFQKSPWTPFVHGGTTYDLSHLDEFEFSVTDSNAQERRIAVTFSDHCFTRDYEPNDDPALFYPGGSRTPGVFSFDRYRHSLDIGLHIARAVRGKVWNASRYHGYQENFAAVPTVNHEGKRVLYAILFSLERGGKDLLIALHMRVRTAYPCDERAVPTFGEVRFSNLVALSMQGKSPARITDPHRRKPTLS
jgi:hypothetical protein